jgi:hypothetical protein
MGSAGSVLIIKKKKQIKMIGADTIKQKQGTME